MLLLIYSPLGVTNPSRTARHLLAHVNRKQRILSILSEQGQLCLLGVDDQALHVSQQPSRGILCEHLHDHPARASRSPRGTAWGGCTARRYTCRRSRWCPQQIEDPV